jgi:hypothetical protein
MLRSLCYQVLLSRSGYGRSDPIESAADLERNSQNRPLATARGL